MQRTLFVTTFVFAFFALVFSSRADERPNIVVILADDLGYGDVQPNNPKSKIPTPHFNELAKQGMTFVDAHSPSAVCTPTRYALLCGRYPWRSSLKRGVLGGYSKPLIEKDRQTIASVLKEAGYTTACVGKWHLGLGWQWTDKPPKDINNMGIAGGKPKFVDYEKPLTHNPTTVGFDQSFIIPASLDMSPYVYIRNDRVTAIPNRVLPGKKFPGFYRKGELAPDFEMDKVLDKLTEQACGFINEQAKTDNPFFLYFPLSAPHKPVLPHERFKGKTEFGPYGDFITQVDWTVGQVMKSLDDAGVADNTILIVTSDNGSFMYSYPNNREDHAVKETVHGFHPETHRSNFIYRGTKADIWEAGHRVPFFVRWPKTVKGNSKSTRTICHTDILATAVELAKADFDKKSSEDSFSFAGSLRGKEAADRPAVIHQSGNGHLAIRKGDWKLVLSSGSGGRAKPRGVAFEKPFGLFNLADDPSEKNNQFEFQSKMASELEKRFYELSHGDHPKPPEKRPGKKKPGKKKE